MSARSTPSSSRMLASYLSDIEQLLEEQRWDAALREASDLPRIAVALSDPGLKCSGDDVGEWCARWLGAQGNEAESHAANEDYEESPASVPTNALRRLQLRRHVRTPPRGYAPLTDDATDPVESESFEAGRALVGAARRWYAKHGCHDPTVQNNLARLAVLR